MFPLGPLGAGKSMLAGRLTSILPAMTLAEAIETMRIRSVVGLTGDRTSLITIRPLRPPHHTISDAGADRRGPRAHVGRRIAGLHEAIAGGPGSHRYGGDSILGWIDIFQMTVG